MTVLAILALSSVEDCYNLMLKGSPLMLTRQGQYQKFQILWPESAAFYMEDAEIFLFGTDGRLYFFAWYKTPEYWEKRLCKIKSQEK